MASRGGGQGSTKIDKKTGKKNNCCIYNTYELCMQIIITEKDTYHFWFFVFFWFFGLFVFFAVFFDYLFSIEKALVTIAFPHFMIF